MSILDLIKVMPKYNYYKDKINLVLKELGVIAVDGDEESLFLRRFEPFIKAPMDAQGALALLSNLKNMIVAPNPGASSVKPKLGSNSPRDRAIKLLDKCCAFSLEPLVSVFGTDVMEAGALISCSAQGSKLKVADLTAANIYVDEHGFWYQSNSPLQPGDKSLINDDGNTILAVTDNDDVVDFTFINRYLAYAHQLAAAKPQYTQFQSELIHALGGVDAYNALYNPLESKDLLTIYFNVIQVHPDVIISAQALESHIADLSYEHQNFFMDNYANVPADLMARILPLAEKYNLIRLSDYARYPVLANLNPLKAEEAVNQIAADVSAMSAPLKTSILSGEFSGIKQAQDATKRDQVLLAAFSSELATYTTKTKTRLEAKKQIGAAIAKGIAAVVGLLRNEQFQKLAGYDENHRKRRFFGQPVLPDICANFLPSAAACVAQNNAVTHSVVTAVNKVSDDANALRAILTDDETYKTLMQNPLQLSEIYSKTPHKTVFIQAIYDHRNAATFPGLALSNGVKLTYENITDMLVQPEEQANYRDAENAQEWDQFNELRHRFKLPAILPKNIVTSKSNGREALDRLTPEEKHQLLDSDIAVGEDYLRKKHKHLLINKVIDSAESKSELNSVSVKSKNIPDVFFFPISEYMLLEPSNTGNANYFRYRNLKKALPEYIKSVSSVNNEPSASSSLSLSSAPSVNDVKKPVVFMGVANVTNNHYIAYFFYQKPNGKMQVITLDPSPQAYLAGTKSRRGELLDGKEKAIAKLKTMFQDIFPDCEYADLNITQQLLQRDCGFNALQTLDDVLSSLNTSCPMLEIKADGSLKINTDGLTVNGNVDRGVNHSSDAYYYRESLKVAGQQNRQIWAERFKEVKQRRLYGKANEQNSIEVPEYVGEIYDEYSYEDNIRVQQRGDDNNENISQIFGQMISVPLWRNIENRFIEQFEEPTAEELAVLEKAVIKNMASDGVSGQSVIDAMLPANQVLNSVLQDLAHDTLYQQIVKAIFARFKSYLDNGKLKVTEADTAATLHERFVGHANVKSLYEKLSASEKSALKQDIRGYAEAKIVGLKDIYFKNLAERIIAQLKKQIDRGSIQDWLLYFNPNEEFLCFDNMIKLKQALSSQVILCDEIDAWPSVQSQKAVLDLVNRLIPVYLHSMLERSIGAVIPKIKFIDRVRNGDETVVVSLSEDEVLASVMKELGVAPHNILTKMAKQKLATHMHKIKDAQKILSDDIFLFVDTLKNANKKLADHGFESEGAKLENYIDILTQMTSYLFNWAHLSIAQIAEMTEMHNKAFNQYKDQIASVLFGLYPTEDTLPHPVAKTARAALAVLLKIDLVEYPTNEAIIAFDRNVKAVLQSHKMPATSAVPSYSVGLDNEAAKNAYTPNTYGRPLTLKLLEQLLDFWKINSYTKAKENTQEFPASIKGLIDIVNEIPHDKEIPKDLLTKLRLLVDSQVKTNDFSHYDKADVTQKVFLSILNASTFSPVNPAGLRLAPSVVEEKSETPPLNMQTMEHVLNLYTGKDKFDKENSEDFGAVNSSQLLENSQTSQVKTLFGSTKVKTDLNPVAVIVQNLLQMMRQRHYKLAGDFTLDYTDLNILIDFLSRYKTIKQGQKLEAPTDRLYWAIASLVSDSLKQYGVSTAAAQLLGIRSEAQLLSTIIPDEIADTYGFDQGASINSIPPQDLIYLQAHNSLSSGYFLDMGWITARYEATGQLINPYTREYLTTEQVNDTIQQSVVIRDKLLLIHAGRMTSPIESHIGALINLVNGLLDPAGQVDLASGVTQKQAAAWEKFYAYRASLDASKRELFDNFEVVPLYGTGEASQTSLPSLQTKSRTRLFTILSADTCGQIISTCIVPVIYQFKGNLDFLTAQAKALFLSYAGLPEAELVKYFEQKKIVKPVELFSDCQIRDYVSAEAARANPSPAVLSSH